MADRLIENLKLRYGALDILKGVSLSVEKGQIVALLGPSGSGKTTLLRCVAGLEEPFAGRISIAGRPFFDVFFDGRFGKRGARGHVYWENESYTDSRVLLSIPRGFDIRMEFQTMLNPRYERSSLLFMS